MMNASHRNFNARPPTGPAFRTDPAVSTGITGREIAPATISRSVIVLPSALGIPTMSLRILSAACLGLTSVLVAITAMESWRWKLALAGIAALCWAHGLRTWMAAPPSRRRREARSVWRRAAVRATLAGVVAAMLAGSAASWASRRQADREAAAGGSESRSSVRPSLAGRIGPKIVPVANHGPRPGSKGSAGTPADDSPAEYDNAPPELLAAAPRPFAAPDAKRMAPQSEPPRPGRSRSYPAATAYGTDAANGADSGVRHAAPVRPAFEEQLDMAAEQRRLEEFMQVAFQSDESQGEGKPAKPARPTPPATTDAQTGSAATPMTSSPMGTTPMTPVSSSSSGSASGGAAAGGAGSATTIGVAPPKEQPEFLRQDSVLLEPGEYQLEFGLAYTLSNSTNTISLQQGGAVFAGDIVRTNRLIISTIDIRLGITPDWQGSVILPFGWSSGQLVFAGADEYSSTGGIGDISVSLTRLLQEGDMESATIMANFSCSAPTGQSNFASSIAVPGASLGQGFWTATAGLTMVRVFDPLVLFGGFGYQHRFDTEIAPNVQLSPGVLGYYRFGVGYAINSKITLNGSFNGSYLTEIHINNRRSAGSAREPLQLRLAMTIANREPNSPKTRKARTVEPYLTIGLTDVAPDAQFGIGWSY